MNQLERNVEEALKDTEASGTRTVMLPKFTTETLLREYRAACAECRKWPIALFVGMVLMLLFGVWLGGKGAAPCPQPKTESQRSVTMYAGSLVHWQHRKRWNC